MFSKLQGGKENVSLTGETSGQRKNVQKIGLLIADEVQLVGGEVGPTYEVIISRTRYVSAQTENKTPIVACGVSFANARDLGEWIGAPSHAIFNFSPAPYLAIVEYSSTKPVILFVPSRRQTKLTVDDILTPYRADEQPDLKFLNMDLESLLPHLDHLSDKGLAETLKHDKRIVQRLFESGAIHVLFASNDTIWSLPVASYTAIIMGVQYFEGKGHSYIEYPVMDVLQMMGRACRPMEDDRSRCVLMCQQTQKDFYRKFLAEGLPIESPPAYSYVRCYSLAEIAVKTIENKQDVMVILTWTYFYRWMTQNPNYYNLHNISHQHLSDHLSEQHVERSRELQVHSRRTFLIQLPPDLAADQQALVLKKIPNLLSACVDVISSRTWLSALGAMDPSQMCVQATWETDSPLKQIPHFDDELIKRSKAAGRDVATFVNSYLTLDVTHDLVKGMYTTGAPIILHVDEDEEDDGQIVVAFYPLASAVQLLVIKRDHHDIALDPIEVAEGEEIDSDEDELDSEED
ncbi:hypothetical protein M378DRAFT_160402 [Amanita muscaria Koide BX008]|uniref:Uncharacterized protein n=1 Tax=Amanita muscaria (strain Koide BX008) TaxID=946122 RepID=A0A0C2XBX6_AMAMK|nr:hypothetical protein M378DRAFT_160402 [Amanita muscaria Koide BX008]